MAAAMSGKSTLGIPKSVGADFVHADKGKHFADGGTVGSLPTMGVSSAYPPPSGQRKEGPRNYGKK
jgi:hypothetical protein